MNRVYSINYRITERQNEMTTTFTHSVTINGQTRDVVFSSFRADMADSVEAVGMYRLPRGGKVWFQRITMWLQKDGSWKVAGSYVIMNRHYPLVGFADQSTGANLSEHNSAR